MPCPSLALSLFLLLVACASTGCIADTGGGSMADETADAGPDATDERVCQGSDLICELEGGCVPYAGDLEACYKRCTPDSDDLIGAPDDECDEPARPYCSQMGILEGGDYACNRCAHVCTAEPGPGHCSETVEGC